MHCKRQILLERVRDKICVSKAKGLWMSGNPPLGYEKKKKKLISNEVEAANVRTLFEKYLELQSVNALTEYATAQKIYAKQWTTAKGVVKGGRPIAKMSMHRILCDRTYVGQIVNKIDNTVAKGEHQAILPTELFERVQIALRSNANNKSESHGSPNLLTGKLFNHNGVRFIGHVAKARPTLIITQPKGSICPRQQLMKSPLKPSPSSWMSTFRHCRPRSLTF